MRSKVCDFSVVIACLTAILIVESTTENSAYEDLYHGKLKLVQVVFRHGDRAPIDPLYPLYPYKDEKYWPEGFGQLTKKGKLQEYELGQYLRARYANFLSSSYSPYEVYVRSSDLDRTIASAQLNLAGLYPPTDNLTLWNPEINWQPIPVHSEPAESDKILCMTAPCPKYDRLKEHVLKHSEEAKQLRQKYASVFELLENKTGGRVKTAEDVYHIYDALFVAHERYNYWPDWAPEGSSTLVALREITKFSFKALAYTVEMQRLRGGPLVAELLRNINEKVVGKLDNRRKLFMFSGHDTTLGVLLIAFGVFDPPQLPPYASIVMLELWEETDNDLNTTHYVKVLFRNETDGEPYLLSVPGCPNPCSLPMLNQILHKKTPADWDNECRTYEFVKYFNSSIVLATVSVIVLILVALSAMVTIIKRRQRFTEKLKCCFPHFHLQQDDEEA